MSAVLKKVLIKLTSSRFAGKIYQDGCNECYSSSMYNTQGRCPYLSQHAYRPTTHKAFDPVPTLLIGRLCLTIIFCLKYFVAIAVILYSLVTFNIFCLHSPLVAAIYVSRSSYHLLQRHRTKTCGILNLVHGFPWLSDSLDGAKKDAIGAIKTKGFFFAHSLIELFRNRKMRAWKTNKTTMKYMTKINTRKKIHW